MSTRILLTLVFLAGTTSGWVGHAWYGSVDSRSNIETEINKQTSITAPQYSPSPDSISQHSAEPSQTSTGNSKDAAPSTINSSNLNSQDNLPLSDVKDSADSFRKLLSDKRYFDAMTLYQELIKESTQTETRLKRIVLDQLESLLQAKNNSDFSELIKNYLSVYYEDIDVLLLLAKFNRSTGSYLEAIDSYLLAKTYAYTAIDQRNVDVAFDGFVKSTDTLYTGQKNWPSLINFYLHIDTAGLLTSPYQFQLAIAYLQNGDEYAATEQLTVLADDSLVGEAAKYSLRNLTDNQPPVHTLPIDNPGWSESETIALQKRGDHYLVDLIINRDDKIKLMIDTGASVTTLSRETFSSLSTLGSIVEKERRNFRTAGGVVQGTIYTAPELHLGPYIMNDTQIAVLDFDTNRNFDGLLGMNVLGQFRFQIDQVTSNLLLSKQ